MVSVRYLAPLRVPESLKFRVLMSATDRSRPSSDGGEGELARNVKTRAEFIEVWFAAGTTPGSECLRGVEKTKSAWCIASPLGIPVGLENISEVVWQRRGGRWSASKVQPPRQ